MRLGSQSFARSVAVFCAFLPLFSGCKPYNKALRNTAGYILGPTSQIKILGDDEKKQLSDKHVAAAVLLTTVVNSSTRKYCSGTIIAPQQGSTHYRIVTNHHCFAAEEQSDQNVHNVALTNGLCENTKVFFGFIKAELANHEVHGCVTGTLRFDLDADLAIFDLDQNPSSRFAPAQIYDGTTIEAGRKASIIHYPAITNGDTADMVYEAEVGFNLPVAQVTLNNCATLGSFPPGEWYLDSTLKMGIKHSCDQTKGSSGSALWDEATDTMLGVDWGGITLNFSNPTRTEIVNVATEAVYLKAFVDNDTQFIKDFDQKAANAVVQAAQDDGGSTSDSSIEKTNKKLTLKKCGSLDGVTASAGGPVALAFWMAVPLLPGAVRIGRRGRTVKGTPHDPRR